MEEVTTGGNRDGGRMTHTADELRSLAREVAELCTKSPANSIAFPIVGSCCDHLLAVARVHELNEKLALVEVD